VVTGAKGHPDPNASRWAWSEKETLGVRVWVPKQVGPD
jgi:hypothetical protein